MSDFEFGDWFRFQQNHVLYDFQKKLLHDSLRHSFVACLAARQVGKTRYLAILSLLLAGGVSGKGIEIPAHDVFIISATYQKSLMVVKEINEVLGELNLIKKISHDTEGGKTEVVLKGGTSITALAGKPGCLQGESGSCLWDEASLTEHDPADIYDQCLAASSARDFYRVIMCTNADQQGSWIWEFFESISDEFKRKRRGFKIHRYNIHQVFPGGLPSRIESRRTMMTSSGWRRFYLNEFVSGDAGRFDAEIIHKATTQTWECKDGLRIMSIDPGFSINGDPTGITVSSVSNDKVEVLHADLWFGVFEGEQRERIGELVKKYHVSRILIDQGVGGGIVRDNLIRTYGKAMVIPVSVSRNKYALWCAELEKLMLEGRLRIRPEHTYLIEDLKSIELDKRGNIVIPKRAHTNGTNTIHCDAAASLMYVTDHVGGQLNKRIAEEIRVDDEYSYGFDSSRAYDKFI